ncbi:MAG: glucose 1-dehydrogenase [Chloroflexota bacterium]|nr:glucose 1-dehydrogenase [Chloroflexota bacterium]
MQAVAITPRQAKHAFLVDLPEPSLDEIPGGRGVLVKILTVGQDGTDKDLYVGSYGTAPEGFDYLVTGHECLGRVIAVGANVTELAVGDYVVPTVRRPGHSLFDVIGTNDMTSDSTYFERGISRRHGFLTERFVEDPEFLVKIPVQLKDVAVLLEPMSIIEKGIIQAFEIQRRLKVWKPRKSAVIGAGPLGILAALGLKLRGIEVTVFARSEPPTQNSTLLSEIGVRYVSTRQMNMVDAAAQYGPFDLIFEASGSSPQIFEAANVLAKNGILILSSITGGTTKTEVASDKLNLDFVLGNKVMFGTVNAHRGYFEQGVSDFATTQAAYPGWLPKLLTHPIDGLANYEAMFQTLLDVKEAIKVHVIISADAD